MVFSNTTNKNGLLQRVEDHTQLGDGVITGDTVLKKKITAHINETLYELTTEIMLSQDNFDWDDPYKTDYPIATTPLVADQRDYQFDSISFLKLKRVDISWDGTTFYRAEPFDSATYREGFGNESLTDEKFSKTKPYYDPKGFGFWLYPRATAADVAAGAVARIEFTRAFDEYVHSDTTKEPPIDRNFHDLIAIGAALKWPGTPDKQFQKLQLKWAEGKQNMIRHYNNRNEDFGLSLNNNIIENYR